MQYAPVIFQQSVGISRDLSLLLAGFNGIAYFFSSLIPIWCIERLGRRKLMLFAAGGQCACMAILAGTVANGSKSAGIVAIVMLFLFNFFFAVGLLAIPWLLPAEYAPLAIRTRAAALATASNWIFTFLVVEITPVSINSIGKNDPAVTTLRLAADNLRLAHIRILWRVQCLLPASYLLLLP